MPIALWLLSIASCRETILSFVENDPTELSDADLAIARMRLLPLYQRRCPSFLLDRFDERLERESQARAAKETI